MLTAMTTISKIGNRGIRVRLRAGKEGFSFVEVMVAVAVLALGIVVIYRSFFVCLDYINHVSNRLHAMVLINNRIATMQKDFELNGEAPASHRDQTETAWIHSKPVVFHSSVDVRTVDNLEGLYQLDASLWWNERGRDVRIWRSAFIVHYGIRDEG